VYINPTAAGIHDAGGIGGLLAAQELIGAHQGAYWYLYDANGNVGQIVENTTSYPLAAHYEYDAYGQALIKIGNYANRNSFRFSTKWEDSAKLTHIIGEPRLILYYYGFRYYSAALGRWVSRDPLGVLAGPQLYSFLGNDPVNKIDLVGLCEACLGGNATRNVARRNQLIIYGAKDCDRIDKINAVYQRHTAIVHVRDLSDFSGRNMWLYFHWSQILPNSWLQVSGGACAKYDVSVMTLCQEI
jgi:RHS repeat-associated protein